MMDCNNCESAVAARAALLQSGDCEACQNLLSFARDGEDSDFLESQTGPAALVDRNLTILSSNIQLQKMVGRFQGLRIGEALDCAYANSQSRCGEAEPCLSCGIRRLVEIARISGETIHEIPTSIRCGSGKDRTFRFTTERTGEAVLLMFGA
jgi:hypothetical protein